MRLQGSYSSSGICFASLYILLATCPTPSASSPTSSKAPATVKLSLYGTTSPIEADHPAVYYYPSTKQKELPAPLLLGNDGSAVGGFKLFKFPTSKPNEKPITIPEIKSVPTGRSKLATVLYDIPVDSFNQDIKQRQAQTKDWIATIAMPDSVLRFFEVLSGTSAGGQILAKNPVEAKVILGDWSALCSWKSSVTGWTYLYLFGKGNVGVWLVRGNSKKGVEAVEVQSFSVPIEAESCTTTPGGTVLFGGANGVIYNFRAGDSASTPAIREVGNVDGIEEIAGLEIYHGKGNEERYLFLTTPDDLRIFSLRESQQNKDNNLKLAHLATAQLPSGFDEFKDLAIYQQPILPNFPDGFIIYAGETSSGDEGFAISSLSPVFTTTPSLFKPNTSYTPRQKKSITNPDICPKLNNCSSTGFCPSSAAGKSSCSCFAGSTGRTCSTVTCPNSCTSPSQGTCTSANTCTCIPPWGGPDCGTLLVPVQYETATTGGLDGDDPAIWIHPEKSLASKSKIITTTKSKQGEGLSVFSLTGEFLQHFSAPEPNNVDVLYSVPVVGSKPEKTIDLAVAGCRGDNTICVFEVSQQDTDHDNGNIILPIAFSSNSEPLPEDFEPYGSCVYHSPLSNHSTYIFINSKSAEYLQYLLTASVNPSTNLTEITTTLTRRFPVGHGGQVEGCVVDDENSRLLIGEEPFGLWAYPAEPDVAFTNDSVYIIDSVLGNLDADVEGVTLIPGNEPDEGYILVSVQGHSAFNIYTRAKPHEFLLRFSLVESVDGSVDAVSNTDGITAVGVDLGLEGFRHGIIVVHDDVNQLPGAGGASEEVSFKIVGVEKVLGSEGLQGVWGAEKVKEVLNGVGRDWNPRGWKRKV